MCEHCRDSREKGFRFCRMCGEYLGEPWGRMRGPGRGMGASRGGSWNGSFGSGSATGAWGRPGAAPGIGIVMKLGLLITLICSVLLLIGLFVAFFKSGYVFENVGSLRNSMVVLLPYPVTFAYISGAVLQFYYVLLLIIVLVSLILVFWKAYGPFMTLVREKDTEPMKNTALFELSVLFAVIYSISVFFVVMLAASGTVVEDPFKDHELWVEMFAYLEASVWEEVVSRIMLIGVPMFILCVLLKGHTGTFCEPFDELWSDTVDDVVIVPEDVPEGLVKDAAGVVDDVDAVGVADVDAGSALDGVPDGASGKKEFRWWNYLLGGTGLSYAALFLIVFSSMIFGLAHIPLWGVWKSFQTFIMGLIFGYIFMKYGVYAAIALHFLADYLSSISWISEPLVLIPGLATLALMGLGFVYIWVYGDRLINFIKRVRNDFSQNRK